MIDQLAMPAAFGSTWAVLTVGHNLGATVRRAIELLGERAG
ncbi:hypothetical protein ACFU6I_11045 [Streptomyces sp. NPDC057486]